MYSSAKKLQKVLSAGEIRKTFIDYFTLKHDHKFLRSSPVIPYCDPTVAFVNAGMNQFKSVFLGKTQPSYKRVANSQKCVRVGGKHNDLNVVGTDGYHHTFFEMLGNWSFGDYFKREACEMALDLLRGPYNIDPKRMYVTYFAGDKILGLPADEECYEIWRSLGFPPERILPFGSRENFWEMGTTGPCGPCTEIHIDHQPDLAKPSERAKLVNAGRADLTELWNLVFIQYNRNDDGTITQLPARHVDTGMGFERLTAVLQNKSSNYDTDIFTPIFQAMQYNSKVPPYNGRFPNTANDAMLDTGYRIVADHARMITACLADGMLPDQNQKLRRVIRKALNLSETVFANDKLLEQIVPVVVETLGTAYPEMYSNQSNVLELIAFEKEVYRSVRDSSSKTFAEELTKHPILENIDLMECPGFVPAYRDFQNHKKHFVNSVIPGKYLFKLNDTYGLTPENFQKLADLENMTCDEQGYEKEMTNAKRRSKTKLSNESDAAEETLKNLTKHLRATDNSFKYKYSYDSSLKTYTITPLKAQIVGMMLNEKEVEQCVASNDDTINIVTNVSNFYYESGGQQADFGKIQLTHQGECNNDKSIELDVINVEFVNDCVVHVCKLPEYLRNTEINLRNGLQVVLKVDADHRKMNTCHHSALHILNAALRTLFRKVTYQVSSYVNSEQCKLEVGLIGKRMTKEDVECIEDLIGRIICSKTPVDVCTINMSDVLQQNDITMIPGEIYPETGLRLVNVQCDNINFYSKELCCGTHVTNTQEVEYFCITNLKQTNRARYAFTAVAGAKAESVLKNAALLKHRVDVLENEIKTDKLTNATEIELQKIRNTILHTDIVLPYVFKMNTLERIKEVLKKLKEATRTTLQEFVEVEMKNLLQEKPITSYPYILHYITSSALMESIPLQKATKLCKDRPVLVVGMCDNIVRARCCVPKKYISEDFSAEKWLREFANIFEASLFTPKGQNSQEVSNMKGKKISTQFEEHLEEAMDRAHKFAKMHL